MDITRRSFLGIVGVSLGVMGSTPKEVEARDPKSPPDPFGCLVDTTLCVGCRKCEMACNEVNGLPVPDTSFDDLQVMNEKRRPDPRAYTVVNRYFTGRLDERNQLVPTFVKVQCMHCQDPACASACIVGALTKKDNGAVRYDVSKCIGCRYCMVACPFQIPTYEYSKPLTPEVRKCTLCYSRITKTGGKPGCADICPVEAITFGKRQNLLKLAHEKIEKDPGRYLNKIYGEHEVGGTSWLYLTGEPFEKLGFLKLPSQPMPHLTETIQHGLFSYLWSPLVLFGVLATGMWKFNKHQMKGDSGSDESKEEVPI